MSELNKALLSSECSTGGRVAIIGAGWAGLQLLQSLHERGIEAELYEKFDTVGGTWSPHLSYRGLHVHSAAWLGAFEGMPYSDCEKINDSKPSAEEMLKYCKRFVDQNKLSDKIHLGHCVVEVRYSTATHQATILIQEPDRIPRLVGPFDLVVYSSLSGMPDMPRIECGHFPGVQLHSSGLKPAVLQEIVAKGQCVAVVGAGKSGADMVSAFHCIGHKEVTWVMRKPYYYFRYETLFHARTLIAKLRALLCLVGLCAFRFSRTFGIVLLWLIGYVRLPTGFHFDATKFHFGVLDQEQFSHLQGVPTKCGEPATLEKDGLRLKDGSLVFCDVVIWATGYSTGIEMLKLYKNDQPFTDLDGRLFDHLLLPTFPCLMSAATAFFHFGPKRSVSLAHYISYHLRRGPLSEHAMLESASRLRCKTSCTKFFAFQSKSCLTEDWLSMYEDFFWLGYVSFSSFLRMAIETFVLGICNPLQLTFPKDK